MWTIAQSVFYGLILVGAVGSNFEPVFQHCCNLGKNKSSDSLKCEGKSRTPITGVPVEQTSICLSTIDLCCAQQVRDTSCESGKQAARQNEICNIQSKLDDEVTYKYCCESCKLGLISGSSGTGCKMKTIRFGAPWDAIYESCCEESFVPTVTPTTNVTQEPQDICNMLPGELCAHICIPIKGSFRCECRGGFTLMADGKSCQQDNVENRCDKHNFCDHNCYDNGHATECSCNPGFELLADNRTCVDVNECNLKLDNCYISGKVCRNTEGGYECVDANGTSTNSSQNNGQKKLVFVVPAITCQAGYKYDVSANGCIDIDECKEGIHACLNSTETCVNVVGGYRCILKDDPQPAANRKCPFGYRISTPSNECVDINECDDDPCERTESCENLIGGYNCKCKIGYKRDNATGACVDLNECQLGRHNCDGSQRCDNTIGSFQCIRLSGCGTGYTLNSETGQCDDDDECVLGTDDCKLLGQGFECRNTPGSFRCDRKRCDVTTNCTKVVTKMECSKGFESVRGTCVDINECNRKFTCRSDQACVNTYGSYKCTSQLTCNPGLRLNNEQTYCVDIDECSEQSGICDHRCINVWGSFRCFCNNGYILHQDNRTCVDINECELFKDRRLCLGSCVNTPGSYKCQCPEGYKLSFDGTSCHDIDECSTNNKCKTDEICLNIRGTYRCNTISCPSNYVRDFDHKNRCIRQNNYCLTNTGGCLQMPLSYSFNYITFVSNVLIPTTGQLDLFHMRGPTSPNMGTEFFLDLKKVQAPLGITRVTQDFFVLTPVSAKQVVVALTRTIQGPQDVELDLKMHLSINGVFTGFTVSKLYIYVSQYDF